MTGEIRENLWANKTRVAYERNMNKTNWPLNSIYKTMSYLNRTHPSDSALKQALAVANRVHFTRNWPPPNFEHPLVDSFIKTLKRRPTTQTNSPITTTVFTKRELELITSKIYL